jgi:hypothetical protein
MRLDSAACFRRGRDGSVLAHQSRLRGARRCDESDASCVSGSSMRIRVDRRAWRIGQSSRRIAWIWHLVLHAVNTRAQPFSGMTIGCRGFTSPFPHCDSRRSSAAYSVTFRCPEYGPVSRRLFLRSCALPSRSRDRLSAYRRKSMVWQAAQERESERLNFRIAGFRRGPDLRRANGGFGRQAAANPAGANGRWTLGPVVASRCPE